MSEEQQQVATPVEVVDTPETDEQSSTVEAGTTEQAAETDEQKNERLVREREERARKRNDGIQRRFNELTQEKRELMEINRRMAEALQGRTQQGQPQTPQRDPFAPPRREDYQDYETYLDKRAEWAAERRFAQAMGAMQQRAAMQSQQQAVTQIGQKLINDVESYRKQAPDYDDVIANLDFEAPPAMSQAILASDSPARVFHALGRNPTEARRIASLPPLEQIKAIGRIEASLSSTPQVSKAPQPGRPVGTVTSSGRKSPSEMTRDEYWASITKDWKRK